MEPSSFTFTPVGFFRGDAVRKYDAPRQGVFAGGRGRVEFAAGNNFEAALRNLEGFVRVWLVFVFDRNIGVWHPTVRPPVTAEGLDRVGVFASRAPYRPNPIGISCVRLLGIKGRSLEVDETDLLDGTPILDVKPYIPAADAFPGIPAGWVDEQRRDSWQVVPTPAFVADVACVRAAGAPDLLREASIQLAHAPFDSTRKRVFRTAAAAGMLCLRMFRIAFTTDAATHTVTLQSLHSGYGAEELAALGDPYADKAFHRALAEKKEDPAREKPDPSSIAR